MCPGHGTASQEPTAPPGWPDIAAAYDVVADDYAERFADELACKPFDRSLLDRYAAAVAGRGPVWDVGCGPAAHVARYLADRGVNVTGVDISAVCVGVARRREPHLQFHVANMCELPAGDGELAGVVAFYSVIHLPRARIPAALAEFRRVIEPGGGLLVAMHGGTGETGTDEWLGHAVQFRATLVTPGELATLVESAGFRIRERHTRAPYEREYPSQRLYIWAEAA